LYGECTIHISTYLLLIIRKKTLLLDYFSYYEIYTAQASISCDKVSNNNLITIIAMMITPVK
jgi:hypothetical protein